MRNRFYEGRLEMLPGMIFVYGANTRGAHGKGSAKEALRYGARYGQGIGLVGNTYGIPTKDHNLNVLNINEIDRYIGDFIYQTLLESGRTYYVTAVGTGLAGYRHDQIAPLFRGCVSCLFPIEWKPYLV